MTPKMTSKMTLKMSPKMIGKSIRTINNELREINKLMSVRWVGSSKKIHWEIGD